MKVAIIGAGLAGLSCAHEFQRHGIRPVIYEANSFIGEAFPHVGAALEVIARPIKNPLEYFKKKFDIHIEPLNYINRVVHHAPHKTTVIKGNLGYSIERSKNPWDIKNQIHARLKDPDIRFGTHADYKPLSEQYDSVVVANGFMNFTNELGCWFEWVNAYVKGAVVLGNFDPHTLIVWINKDYCRNGYAYLTPFNNKKASLILVVTDVDEKEIEHYWELFLYTENIRYPIVEAYKLNHRSGYVHPLKVGNIYFAGNAAGAIDPFLGFGIFNSVYSGTMAARAIVKNTDYEKQLKFIVKKNLQLYEFRKGFNQMNNQGYDLLMSSIGIPGLKHLIYYTPIDIVKQGARILKSFIK